MLEEASKGAKDLTNLIKRKKPAEGDTFRNPEPHGIQSNGKRKVDSRDEVEGAGLSKREKISHKIND